MMMNKENTMKLSIMNIYEKVENNCPTYYNRRNNKL